MRRVLILLASCLLFLFAGSTTAQASSPHFKKGGKPVCTISYSNLYTSSTVCKTVLAGLGNDDLRATVTVNGFAKYECQNQGGNTAPGQNKVLEGPESVPTDIDSSAIKNGNLSLTTNAVTLAADPTATAAEAGCPNNNWTGVNPVLTVTSILLVIEQPVGTTIFRCSASDPAGLDSPVALTC